MDIEYDIVSGGVTPEGLVQFSVQGGQLTLEASLDHEAMPQHRIVLANATRHTTPRLVDYLTVTLLVMDVNDNAPEFLEATLAAEVAEDAPEGAVVAVLAAEDRDGGSNGQVRRRRTGMEGPMGK